MSRLDLEGVSKVFDRGVTAVRGLHLSVADGELLSLVGPSGCGKTTILRLIAGLEGPTEGTVRIGGRDVAGDSPAQRDVAMVFARGALYPQWTVRRNLSCGARWHASGGNWWRRLRRWWTRHPQDNRQNDEVEAAVRQVAEQLGIADLLDRYPAELSDGQRQRVALGRAMVRRPALYLMDEPLTGLDEPRRCELRRELKQWQSATRATVVYVTHDQTEALLMGDRVAVMNQGELQQIGTPQQVYGQPSNRFVASFIGEPAMNLTSGKWSEEANERGSVQVFTGGGWRVPVTGVASHPARNVRQQLVLGIRPDEIRVVVEDAKRADPEIDGQIAARVDWVESTGGRHVAYVVPAGGGDRWAVRWNDADVTRRGPPYVGDEVHLWIAAERMMWFDEITGTNLTLLENT